MEEIESNRTIAIENNDEKNNEQFISNIFSQIGNFEKNKRYYQLQNDLNVLKQDVKLMEDFSNNRKNLPKKKSNFSKRISIINNDKDMNKRNLSRGINGIYFRRRMSVMNNSNEPSNNNLTIVTNENNKNSGNRVTFKSLNINDNNNKIKKIKITQNKNNVKNRHKTIEPNKNYNKHLKEEKLPYIFHSPDRITETNIDTINTNTNSSPILPLISDRNSYTIQKGIYITSSNDIDNNSSLNENMNDSDSSRIYQKIPTNKNNNLRNNSILKKFPNIINSRRLGSGLHKDPLTIERIVKNMKEKNDKITKRIKNRLAEQNMINWEMKSKFKLAQWKYGIAETQKYFIDMQAYGKPEEDELIKRKTFYDLVEDLIDDIKKTKNEKEIKSIEDKYNGNRNYKKFGDVKKKVDKKKEDNKNNDDLYAVDNAINKSKELSDVLKKIELRKIREQKKRDLIDNIFFKCDLRQKSINNSTSKLIKSQNKLNKSFELKNEKSKNILEVEKDKDKDNDSNEENEESFAE